MLFLDVTGRMIGLSYLSRSESDGRGVSSPALLWNWPRIEIDLASRPEESTAADFFTLLRLINVNLDSSRATLPQILGES